MRASNKGINKYLNQYAEPEVELLSTFPQQLSFEHTVVIPAYKETLGFLQAFIENKLSLQNVLLIVVVNQPDIDSNMLPQQQLFNGIISNRAVQWRNEILTLVEFEQGNSSILVVDRFTKQIPADLGVGLARKIGVDLACSLINKNIIKSDWIHSSDADAVLPSHYFSVLTNRKEKGAVAACYNFLHQCENKVINEANEQYEHALRYYVAGLTYANSPYNFFTIGSILAFKADSYTAVRGFPKRSAGEDFYLLNKLAKLGESFVVEKLCYKIRS